MFLGNSILKEKKTLRNCIFFHYISGSEVNKSKYFEKREAVELNDLPLQKYLFSFPIYLYPLPNSSVKLKKIGTPKIIIKIVLKLEKLGFAVIYPQDADGMTNSVDPDQTVPLGAV